MRYIRSLDEVDEETRKKVMMSFFRQFLQHMAKKPHVSDEKLMDVLGVNRETLCRQFPELNEFRYAHTADPTSVSYKTACNKFTQSNTF
jgi:hypothetical protein